jgi:ArsR family transcriptional regulator
MHYYRLLPKAGRVMLERKAEMLQAMGQDTRLKILALLGSGERCVCDIQAALAEPQPNISRHLAILRRAGIARSRRSRNRVVYGLRDPRIANLLEQLNALVGSA